jgi:hypothetical protein
VHLLYLDDSGSPENTKEDYLVLGGISIFEAQAHYLTQQLDDLAESINPQNPDGIEFHASEIFGGRSPPWSTMTRKEERIGVIKAVLKIVSDAYESARVFASAVQKKSVPSNQDPMEVAFEDLTKRFDLYLDRIRDQGDRQRGLIILDTSAYETSLQTLARDFRRLGTRWGVVRNIADTPMFLDSRSSRIIQIADHIAYSVFRYYQAEDVSYFNIISNKFDEDGGVIHGLSHVTSNTSCVCPGCLSRRRRIP